MNGNSAPEILREKKLRVTNVRSEVLKIFEKKNYALSYNDLHNELRNKFDMATIYRTLATFVENNIIHQVPLDAKTSYYALNNPPGAIETSHKEHVHFVCKKCNRTFCIDEILIHNIVLKKNFKLDSLKIIAEGTCGSCSNK
ncbi:MAG: transcriptional repressor [Melioribacteraceae bacterium]|nr:MAG: transcriptional repressor [Melioribacteraceae bacterium]